MMPQMGRPRPGEHRKPVAGQDAGQGSAGPRESLTERIDCVDGCCQVEEPHFAAEETGSGRLSEVLGKYLWN